MSDYLVGTPENIPTIRMWFAIGLKVEWITASYADRNFPWYVPPDDWEKIGSFDHRQFPRVAFRIKRDE